ncbi:MerR family transcriptional regulator [Roseibium aquae]|uniref:MerR family transcriptional regulator n=1 Tax=Roseibium aquae TaxID=1323746 RepID=A0A916TLM1_9HYPH|nr:helix-turn-helix domain-containing protein [Roseibium aquae]GGB47480.1 MerR family transcriptional regulator [Roseibium aquae]
MTFSIGELSKRAGVKVPTIRYYEREGLIEEPVRTGGNQRRYSISDLERLSFLRHCRDLGLPMNAIRELIDLSQHPDRPCGDANRIATEQLSAVRARIAHLRQLETELERIVLSCSGDHAVADCNVLKAFADHAMCQGEH